MYPLRHYDLATTVRRSPVDDQNNAPKRTGSYRPSKVTKCFGKELGVHFGQTHKVRAPPLGLHKAVEIKPFIARLYHKDRALALGGPDTACNWQKAHPVFIKSPEFHHGFWVLSLYLVESLEQSFF